VVLTTRLKIIDRIFFFLSNYKPTKAANFDQWTRSDLNRVVATEFGLQPPANIILVQCFVQAFVQLTSVQVVVVCFLSKSRFGQAFL
jgi:hypothetical protein